MKSARSKSDRTKPRARQAAGRKRTLSSESEITLAVVRSEIINFRQEATRWHDEDLAARRAAEAREFALAGRMLEVEKKTATSVEEREGLRRDVDKLEQKSFNWNLGNSLAGGILAFYSIFIKR